MGSSSKVLLVGATSLIVGVYAISLKNVQTANLKVAQSQVNRVQNERLVDAGLILALDKVKSTGGNVNETVSGKQVFGGIITYSISGANGNTATISLTVTKNGIVRRVKATVAKISTSNGHGNDSHGKRAYRRVHRSDWQITSVYDQRS